MSEEVRVDLDRSNSLKDLSIEEKRKLRLQRFNMSNTNLNTADSVTAVELENQRKVDRQKRFQDETKEKEVDKKQQRLERFGPTSQKKINEIQRQQRLDKFGPANEDDAKRLRMLRFGKEESNTGANQSTPTKTTKQSLKANKKISKVKKNSKVIVVERRRGNRGDYKSSVKEMKKKQRKARFISKDNKSSRGGRVNNIRSKTPKQRQDAKSGGSRRNFKKRFGNRKRL